MPPLQVGEVEGDFPVAGCWTVEGDSATLDNIGVPPGAWHRVPVSIRAVGLASAQAADSKKGISSWAGPASSNIRGPQNKKLSRSPVSSLLSNRRIARQDQIDCPWSPRDAVSNQIIGVSSSSPRRTWQCCTFREERGEMHALKLPVQARQTIPETVGLP